MEKKLNFNSLKKLNSHLKKKIKILTHITMTKLCQTLILRKGRVLLGTWKKGPFAGRVTGLIGKSKNSSETPEMVAKRQCTDLAQGKKEKKILCSSDII